MTGDSEIQWRLDNARHLKGVRLRLQPYVRWSKEWDHDHCAACGIEFAEFGGPDIQHEGNATCDDYPRGARYEWVCVTCFVDLKNEMGWTAVDR